MITVESSVCIAAPVDDVWAQLARLEDIRLWSEAVLDAHCPGPIAEGSARNAPASSEAGSRSQSIGSNGTMGTHSPTRAAAFPGF